MVGKAEIGLKELMESICAEKKQTNDKSSF